MAKLLCLGLLTGLLFHVGSSIEVVAETPWSDNLLVARQKLEAAAGPESTKEVQVKSLNKLGDVFHLLGCYSKAADSYKQSLELDFSQTAIHKKHAHLVAEMFALEDKALDEVVQRERNPYVARYLANTKASFGNITLADMAYTACENLDAGMYKVDDPERSAQALCDQAKGECCGESRPTALVVTPPVEKVFNFVKDMDVLQSITGPLRAGEVVHIENALVDDLAAELFKDLDNLYGKFSKRNWNELDDAEQLMAAEPDKEGCEAIVKEGNYGSVSHGLHEKFQPSIMKAFGNFLRDIPSLTFFHELSGLPLAKVGIQINSYHEGDYLVHPEGPDVGDRALGFYLDMTKIESENCEGGGGEFIRCSPFEVKPPAFNRLTLFKVTPESGHYFNMVKPECGMKNFVIAGFFHRGSVVGLKEKPPNKDGGGHPNQDLLESAASSFEEATKLQPDDAPTWEYLSMVRRLANDKKSERDAYKVVAELRPDGADLHLRHGRASRDIGDLKDAKKAFAKAVELQPGDARFLSEQAELLLEQKDWKKAKKVLKQATELKPSEANLWDALGESYEGVDDLKNAEEAYRKTIKLTPNHNKGFLHLGIVLGRQEKYSKAQTILEKARTLHPKDAQIRYNLGFIYNIMEEKFKAARAMEKAYALDPNMFQVEFELGQILSQLGELEEAKKRLEHYLTDEHANKQHGYYELGMLLEKMGEHKGAKVAIEKCLAAGAGTSNAYLRLGIIKRTLREFDGAKVALEKSMELGSAPGTLPLTLQTLGEVLEELGESDEAEKVHKRLLDAQNEDSKAPKIW